MMKALSAMLAMLTLLKARHWLQAKCARDVTLGALDRRTSLEAFTFQPGAET
jgi:hypothetical protein